MITIVSGIPRSGTSLMMQMLAAGGMDVLTDRQRPADDSNPRGYYEVAAVKSLARSSEIIAAAEDKVVKVISSLLKFLPGRYQYRVIFMRRPLDEVLASQDRMLERLGREVPSAPRELARNAFEQHLRQMDDWLAKQSNMNVLYVDHGELLRDSRASASKVCAFLERDLDIQAMAGKVDQSLHREKIHS